MYLPGTDDPVPGADAHSIGSSLVRQGVDEPVVPTAHLFGKIPELVGVMPEVAAVQLVE